MSFQDLEAGRLRQPQRQLLQRQQQDPSQAVVSGIFRINTAVSSFSRLVNSLGTPKDTLELRDKLSVIFFFFWEILLFFFLNWFLLWLCYWDGNSTSGFCFCLLGLVKSYWEPIEVLSICAISDCTLCYESMIAWTFCYLFLNLKSPRTPTSNCVVRCKPCDCFVILLLFSFFLFLLFCFSV